MISPFSIVAALAAATFAWHGVSGIRKGEVRLPVEILGADTYDRDHTLYWAIVGLNFVLSGGLLAVAYLTREISI